MKERRQSQRRVSTDRRKSPRRVRQIPVDIERRATADRRKGDRRVIADRRQEVTKLTCSICREDMDGFNLMLNHLIEEHKISNQKAMFLTKKMIEWKQEILDPTLFPPDHYTYFRRGH